MKIGYKSDVGRRRDLDEDSIVIVRSDVVYESRREQAALLVLADGMGGHNAGEVASCLAAKRVAQEMTRVLLKKGQGELPHEKIAAFFRTSIEQANEELYMYAKENPQYKGMGTTVTAAAVVGTTAYIGHVGDSRAYIVNAREVRQITKDHSLVRELVDSGRITEEEARVHPQKNLVTRTVGIREEVEVDIFREVLHENDFLLVCCDGLTDMVTDEEIHAVVMECDDPQRICDTLVRKANDKGGFDNISVIVARIDELQEDVLKRRTEIRSGRDVRFRKEEEK